MEFKPHGIDETFIAERIDELRIRKGVSEYKMSLDMGHSKNYIQNIRTKRSSPSLSEFFNICNYLETTPTDFFNNKK